ncbi:MAG: NAD-dependent epimerase/dehydratase family protein [Candidatus Melainabacteria bacterium]
MALKKTILVLGATGYIGRRLIQRLRVNNPEHQIFGLSMPGEPNAEAEGWRSLEGDVMQPHLARLLEELQPDEIYHAIGIDRYAPLKNQLLLYAEGTRHLLQSLVDVQSPARVVIVGSAAEYGPHDGPVDESAACRPNTEYGVSKLAQTQVAILFARQYKLPVMIGRVFNVYGQTPQNFVVASLAAQVARLELGKLSYPKLKLKNTESVRDLIHIDDAADALIAIADRGCPGEIYNIGSGRGIAISALLQRMLDQSPVSNVEVQLQGEQIPDFSEADVTKMIRQTGWQPQIDLETGLAGELTYWRDEVAFQALHSR